MICCFTGPRAFPWKEESSQRRDVLRQLDAAILQAIELGATHFLCGNAIGVDTWAAELLIRQKKQHPELFLEIALPFASHNEREFACCAVCQLADWVHVVGNAKCRRAAFYQRDRYLVDHSGLLIAVESLVFGGTARTVQMARAKGTLSCGFTPLPHKGRGDFLAHNSRNRPHNRFPGIPQQAR